MNLRILFVDDEAGLNNYFLEVLHDQGYRVELCTDADAAIDLFDRMEEKSLAEFDLVVLDMLMPVPKRVDPSEIAGEHAVGAFLLRQLRSWNDFVPVIVLTQLEMKDVLAQVWTVFQDRQRELHLEVPNTQERAERVTLLERCFRTRILQKADYPPSAFAASVERFLSQQDRSGV